jgi:hypothetical protein
MTTYWRIGKSRVVHKETVVSLCYYAIRADRGETSHHYYDKKPRNCSVCDECARLEKKARAAARRKMK